MTNIIVSVIEWLKGIVMKLPDLSVDSSALSSMIDGIEIVISFIAAANYIVPISTILTILALVYGFKVIKFTVFLINWVVRRIFDIIP